MTSVYVVNNRYKRKDGTIVTYQTHISYTKRPPKYTPEQAVEIRRLYSEGTQKRRIMERYNISYYIINKILRQDPPLIPNVSP